ncbi:hypothetical protein BPJM79_30274 [Bacillus pumilus]
MLIKPSWRCVFLCECGEVYSVHPQQMALTHIHDETTDVFLN